MSFYRQPGMLTVHSHDAVAPWQTPEWHQQMREQLRPSAYLRLIENKFASGESEFVPLEWWDACVDPNLSPVTVDPN